MAAPLIPSLSEIWNHTETIFGWAMSGQGCGGLSLTLWTGTWLPNELHWQRSIFPCVQESLLLFWVFYMSGEIFQWYFQVHWLSGLCFAWWYWWQQLVSANCVNICMACWVTQRDGLMTLMIASCLQYYCACMHPDHQWSSQWFPQGQDLQNDPTIIMCYWNNTKQCEYLLSIDSPPPWLSLLTNILCQALQSSWKK